MPHNMAFHQGLHFFAKTRIIFREKALIFVGNYNLWPLKEVYFCPIEIISCLTDKGQFLCLTGLNGPKEVTFLYEVKFLSLTRGKYQYFIRKNVDPSCDHFIAPCKEVIITS